MANLINRNAKYAGRANQRGSVLVEGCVGSVIITAIAVSIFVFFVNMAAQLFLQAQVAQIADETAKATDEYRFWLGQPRPGFSENSASEKATNIARALCERVGLGGASVVVTYEKFENVELTNCQVNVNAVAKIPFRLTLFGFDFASLFPGNVSARGIAAHAKVRPYAVMQMDAPHGDKDQSVTRPLGFNERDVAVIPVYGFFYNATGTAGAATTPYGKGIAKNLTPENSFALNHYSLKKQELEYVQRTKGDVFVNGWNPVRRIDNQTIVFH